MAQGSGFWKWYAEVNDDIRHHLIDKHRGQGSVDPAMGRNVEEMARRAQENPRPDYEGVRSYNPHVPQPIENIGMHVTEQDAENVKSTMERFYGGNQRPEPDAAEIHRFYGRDPAVPAQPDPAAEREREEAMKRFYGHTPYEPRELDDHTARLAHDAAVREYYQRDDGERER